MRFSSTIVHTNHKLVYDFFYTLNVHVLWPGKEINQKLKKVVIM